MATSTNYASTAQKPKAEREVKLVNYLAYGGNDVIGAGSMAVISAWVLIFYTQFCGLSVSEAGLIFAAARILDAIASPLIGHISDHFGSTSLGRRFGRRRFFVMAAIPLLPSFALMWLPGQTFWYYLVSYVMFELVYAMIIIPYETLAAEMSSDYKTKAKFAGYRILFGQASAILAGFLPLWIIEYLGRDSADTFLYMGVIFACLFMFVAWMLHRFSWERDRLQDADKEPPTIGLAGVFRNLFGNLFATLRIRAFRLHLGMYLGGYISQDIFNAAFTFFVIFALAGSTAIAASLLGTMFIVQFFAVLIAINLALRWSPSRAYQLAATFFAAGVIALLVFWSQGATSTSALIYVAICLAGLGRGALNYIPWATYNYMADVDEAVTGQRREGSFAGIMTFVRKATQAAAVAAVGLLMEAGGFVSGEEVQSAQALETMATILGVGVVGVLVAGIIVSTRFRLGPKTHAILMEEIEHLRSGAANPSSEQHKEVVEDLTGWSYDKLWGRNDVLKKH